MKPTTFPTLYKKTSTGATQCWTVAVEGNTIITRFGQVNGAIQETRDVIKEGKNIGKKNETSPEKQAELQAQSDWTKKIERKGYVEEMDRAEAGENNAAGGIDPMLAKKYFADGTTTELEDGAKIKFPALLQPKLDGIRCIAVVNGGKCTLWSRTKEPIVSVPHINAAYEKHFGQGNIVLDGELYSNNYSDNFEHIVHLVKQKLKPIEGYEAVQHHVYDLPSSPSMNRERCREIGKEFASGLSITGHIVEVATVTVESREDMMKKFRLFREMGYEGAIVRNATGLYVNKRSFDLQKVVETITEEFKILGIEEGKGKLQGHVGAFLLEAKNGQAFKAKMSGDTDRLKEYFNKPSLWKSKSMTVRFRTLTRKNNVPRFPVALAIRSEYE